MRHPTVRGLRVPVCVWAPLAALAAAGACAQSLPSRAEPVLSTSGQFVIHAPGSPALAGNAFNLSPDQNLVRLEPTFVGVSCERIKQSLLGELGPAAPWQVRIYVEVRPARITGQPVTITSEHFSNGWQYQVELPAAIERERYARAIMQVLLLERANRGSSGRLAEIPVWLTEGLTQRLLASKEIEIILPPPHDTVNGLSFSSTRVTQRVDDPVGHARKQLHGQTPLTFEQLSWQAEDELSGAPAQLYRASAQLFVGELLRLRDGRACLATMLARLPRYQNWQLAFLEAFHNDFERLLDVEKWWALGCVKSPEQFPARQLAQKPPAESTWDDLDQALHTTVPSTPGSRASQCGTNLTLQTIISEWDHVQQLQTLTPKVQQLGLLRSRLSPDLAMLLQEYGQSLEIYLQNRHWSRPVNLFGVRAGLSRGARETLERLDALDARREALRPAKTPLAAADVISPPAPHP